MKLAPGAATDLPHPEDMDGVGRGAGLCVVHSEAGEAGDSQKLNEELIWKT